MIHLKTWLITAFVLAFLAGGGAGIVVDRILARDPVPRATDVDGYVKVFRTRIGDVTMAQERAVRAEYQRYFNEVSRVTRDLIEENRDRFRPLRTEYVRRILEQLDGEQRTRWQEKTGATLSPGPPDPDAGRDGASPGAEDPGENDR